MFRRRTLLALMIVGVVPAFVLINSVVSAARSRRESIAVDWAQRGDVDLAHGNPAAAAEDYETADEYARERGRYRLQLAQALAAADRIAEARAQLDTLWNQRPGDGYVNLLLARLSSRDGRLTDAVRYYHAAIDGAWEDQPGVARRNTRLELARLLLARGERTQAQAELLTLAGDLPTDPTDPAAERLSGEIAFDTGDYRSARRFLDRAKPAGLDADGERMLDLSTRVVELDPYARGIPSRERLRRVVRVFEVASAALDRCDSDALAAPRYVRDMLANDVNERALGRDPDAVDETLLFAFEAVSEAHTACGEGQGDERAVELMFQQRRPAA